MGEIIENPNEILIDQNEYMRFIKDCINRILTEKFRYDKRYDNRYGNHDENRKHDEKYRRYKIKKIKNIHKLLSLYEYLKENRNLDNYEKYFDINIFGDLYTFDDFYHYAIIYDLLTNGKGIKLIENYDMVNKVIMNEKQNIELLKVTAIVHYDKNVEIAKKNYDLIAKFYSDNPSKKIHEDIYTDRTKDKCVKYLLRSNGCHTYKNDDDKYYTERLKIIEYSIKNDKIVVNGTFYGEKNTYWFNNNTLPESNESNTPYGRFCNTILDYILRYKPPTLSTFVRINRNIKYKLKQWEKEKYNGPPYFMHFTSIYNPHITLYMLQELMNLDKIKKEDYDRIPTIFKMISTLLIKLYTQVKNQYEYRDGGELYKIAKKSFTNNKKQLIGNEQK